MQSKSLGEVKINNGQLNRGRRTKQKACDGDGTDISPGRAPTKTPQASQQKNTRTIAFVDNILSSMDPTRWRPIFACFLSTVVSSGLLVVSTHMIIYLPNSWDKLAVKFKGWLAAVSLIHLSQWIPSHISFLNRRD